MRRLATLPTLLVALAVAPAHAQAPLPPPAPTVGATTAPGTASGGNVSAVGRKMPPATGRMPAAAADPRATGRTTGAKAADAKVTDTKAADAKTKAATEAEMLKAQKAAEARNKAWDARMRKTMGSICSGC